MMILMTFARNTSQEPPWQVVERLFTRWMGKVTIRHIKQSYRQKDRLFKYGKVKAMAAVVLATMYFNMTWISTPPFVYSSVLVLLPENGKSPKAHLARVPSV